MEKQLVKDWSVANEADQNPVVAREEAGIKYNSAERRQGLADSLDGVADKEYVRARLSADQDRGTPPSAALAKASGKSPQGTQDARHQRAVEVEALAQGHEPLTI